MQNEECSRNTAIWRQYQGSRVSSHLIIGELTKKQSSCDDKCLFCQTWPQIVSLNPSEARLNISHIGTKGWERSFQEFHSDGGIDSRLGTFSGFRYSAEESANSMAFQCPAEESIPKLGKEQNKM
jgi:hypothetical protein